MRICDMEFYVPYVTGVVQ